MVATNNLGVDAHYVQWMVEHRTASGMIGKSWEVKYALSSPASPNAQVSYGAPGLAVDTEHFFRVSFCNVNDFCTCWSPRSTGISTDSSYLGEKPDLPPYGVQEVEDSFSRPASTAKSAGGAGLGPDEVWDEMLGGSIVESGGNSYALFPPTAFAEYTGVKSTHQHNYAELEFSLNDTTDTDYNVDIEARIIDAVTEIGPDMKAYVVKLVKGQLGFSQSTLLIGRTTESPAELPPGATITCNPAPPLTDGNLSPVWLRIEVDDDETAGVPTVTGTAFWGCDETGCSGVCTNSRIDTGIPDEDSDLKNVANGGWGFTTHHKFYRLYRFRSGGEDTCGNGVCGTNETCTTCAADCGSCP